MKKIKIALTMLTVCILSFARPACAHPGHERAAPEENQGKKAILVVSFGTSVPSAEKGITNLVGEAKKAFPDHEVRLAYTSNIIRRKIAKDRNLLIPSPSEALAELNDDGFTQVCVAPTMIIPGVEYENIKSVTDAFSVVKGKYGFKKVTLGKPFLATIPHCELMAGILAERFAKELSDKDTAIVLMGHGSPEHFSHSLYAQLQIFLDEKAPSRFFVGTVEAAPVIKDIVKALKKTGSKKIVLSPFMIVAGDHALNDMADREDGGSWLNVLKAAGYKDISLRQEGLGEDPRIAEIFVNNIREMIK